MTLGHARHAPLRCDNATHSTQLPLPRADRQAGSKKQVDSARATYRTTYPSWFPEILTMVAAPLVGSRPLSFADSTAARNSAPLQNHQPGAQHG